MNRGKQPTVGRKRQRARDVELLLVWQEGGPELHAEFHGDFSAFSKFAEKEAWRLVESAGVVR